MKIDVYDVMVGIGIAAVTAGLWMITVPAGLIGGGVLLIAAALILARAHAAPSANAAATRNARMRARDSGQE